MIISKCFRNSLTEGGTLAPEPLLIRLWIWATRRTSKRPRRQRVNPDKPKQRTTKALRKPKKSGTSLARRYDVSHD